MAGILSGPSMMTADGVTHSNPVAKVAILYVDNIAQIADLTVFFYHNSTTLLNKTKPIQDRSYHFTVGGAYPFEQIVIPGQNAQANFFNYIKSLPEFSGWSEI